MVTVGDYEPLRRAIVIARDEEKRKGANPKITNYFVFNHQKDLVYPCVELVLENFVDFLKKISNNSKWYVDEDSENSELSLHRPFLRNSSDN